MGLTDGVQGLERELAMTLPAMQAQLTKVTQTVAELEQTSVEFANSVTELYGRVVRVMTAAAVPDDSEVHMDIRGTASQQTAAAMEPTMQDRLMDSAAPEGSRNCATPTTRATIMLDTP